MVNERRTTKELLELDRQYVWHPFTPMKAWMEKKDPLIIARGQDEFLFDTDGRQYIDAVSSLWCNIHGHHVPELDQAVRDQLDQVAHSTLLGLCNIPSIELAARLIDIAPRGLQKVFFSDNGSTAVEVACKMAYQFWANQGQPGKSRFLAFSGAYHGDTLGAVSVGGIPAFHQVYAPLCFPVDRVDPPQLAPFAGLNAATESAAASGPVMPWEQQMESLILANPGVYAGIVIEPVVQGAGGMIMHPPGTLKRLRQLADRHNLLLICDEVMTGFGRTGLMFACDHDQICPELLCLSKGLTGGYMPLGATLTTGRCFDAFYGAPQAEKTFNPVHTYTGRPLACAVGIASLDLFASHNLLEHSRAMGRLLWEEISVLQNHDHIGDLRQVGLTAAIDIVKNCRTGERYPWQWRVGGALCNRMRDAGILMRPLGDVLVIMPPLAIRAQNVKSIARAVVECIDNGLDDIVSEREAK